MRMGRWLLFFLAIASVPSLILLLIYQQWALAMALGAGILTVPTLLNWRVPCPNMMRWPRASSRHSALSRRNRRRG
jgi:hypothetical protein